MSIIIDTDSEFAGAFRNTFMALVGIDHNMTTVNLPEAAGQEECTNYTLAHY